MSYYGKSLYLDFNTLPQVDRRFALGRILARGTSATIYHGVDREAGDRMVAVKVLKNLAENVEFIEEEYRIFKNLSRHGNFPTFYGGFLNKFDKADKDELWLVMEQCEGSSLGDLLYNMGLKSRKLSEPLIGYIVRELLNALSYLHMNHIIHRDVKAANVLLTLDGGVKLSDFGFARHLKHTMSRRCTSIGSPHWMAPEVITSSQSAPGTLEPLDDDEVRKGYDHHCDVWSLGITTIEMADGEPPLWKLHPVRVLFQIVNNPPPEVKVPLDWSANFRDFIAECLIKNPDHRPVIMELMDHPFIQEIPEDTGMLQNQLKVLITKHASSVDLERPHEVIAKNGKLKMEPDGPFKKIYPDDLASLENVDEEKVLLTLGNRFSRGQFQTYAGTALLIINPLAEQPSVYEKEHHERHMFKARSDEEPHVYAVVDRAWQDMLHHREHQNIILSGDRNSGKSFNFAQIINHLCYMAKGNQMVAERVEQLPAILDCFGNAATEGNANSSRHVRYLDMKFTESGKLSGAIISLYLLEKWRISETLSKSNRNYHIFYYVYYGLKYEELSEKYFLDGQKDMRFLPIGDTDAEIGYYLNGYKKLKKHFRFWDMEGEEQEFIFQTIAAILLLGQIRFGDQNGQSFIANPDILNKVATLLSVDSSKLGWALCNSSKFKNGNVEVESSSVSECGLSRDALARGLYCRLVDWLVNVLNLNMCLGRKAFGEKNSMGILDPPGFDSASRRNSFEQLISNITNEQLSYHYNQNLFSWEMQDYKDEEIQMGKFAFRDNRSVLNAMLSKPDGLLAVIDEQSRSLDASDQTILDHFERVISPQHVQTENDGHFVVHHSGGDVRYRIDDYLKRNNDFLSAELINVMRKSGNARIANVFTNKMTKTGHVTSDPGATQKVKKSTSLGVPTNNKGFNTLSQGQYSQTRQMQTMGMKTRQSLIQLLQKLVHGSPHFIRCLRRCKTASGTVVLDKAYLADQIRACNLVETIRIRQNGYAYRIPFVEFLRRYQFLAFDYDETVDMTQDNCRLLLLRLKMPQEGWMMGKTKVFLKYHTEEYLSRLYESQVRKIVKVQAIMRAVMVKLKKKQGGSSRPAQRRQPIRTANDMSKDEAALAIQKSYRGYSVRKEYGCAPGKPKRFQCVTIQEEAANTIQYFWRKWKGKSIYQQLLLYRAAKQQDLTYFCQQVHIYNQESCGNVRKTEAPVNLREISIRPRLANRSIPKPTGPKKLPLLLKNRHFLDTTFMCVKAFNKSDLVVRQKPISLDLPNAAPMNKNNRTPSPPSSQSASRYGRYDDKSPATRNRTPSPKQSPSNPVTERSISPNTNGASPNKINIQVTEWNRKSPEPPKYGLSKPVGPKVNAQPTYTGYSMAKPSDQRQIAKEIERKAVELGKTSNEEDAAPFNFQVLDTSFNNYSVILTHFVWHKGMLKKTNYSRGSLKRQNGEKADSENNFGNRATSPSVVYQSKPGYSPTNIKISHQAPSPTLKHQIIPGLVIEGEEADL
ncbi:hypothetical protein GHT06_012610 [Daphnia sinensis]|uniref:non-specific serine/threonine protein kinase n=1 Tax=Daphnia sinensis TaxID=1820382 RepID=A0AAD5LGM4_9CRUS|nr:hypothetical protein GHT06_012610 [Daphnia sinensis]